MKNSQESLVNFLKVILLLPYKYKKQFIFLLFFSVIGILLEAMGIGLVIPITAIMIDENVKTSYPALAPLIHAVGDPDHRTLMLYAVLTLMIVYIIKAIFLALLFWKQSKFIYNIKLHFDTILFKKYIYAPYNFHLQRNSGKLIANITTEMQQLTGNALIPIMFLIAELNLMLVLGLLVLYVEPIGGILLFTFMVSGIYLFQKLTAKSLKNWGKERQTYESLRIQKAHESLGGIKDVKIYGKEYFFANSYLKYLNLTNKIETKQLALSQLPRIWLETIGIIGLVILIIVVLSQNDNLSSVIPIVGMFATMAFRLLPSANRVLTAMQQLKYSGPVMGLIVKELKNIENKKISDEVVSFNSKIEVKNLFFNFHDSKKSTLKDINLSINIGESVGLIGPSGAGKSTLVDMFLGLFTATKGGIYADGKNIEKSIVSWQRLIGYVPQNIFLIDDTLRRNIAFGIQDEEIDEKLLTKAIQASEINEFLDSLPEGLETNLGEGGVRLSGGQKQRVGIARALYNDPSILIFDEATSALDEKTEMSVMKSINALKGSRTIIIIAHRLTTIKECDKVFKIQNGSII